jgi:hypothetical protein
MYWVPDRTWSTRDAVCATVIYADLFDFALTEREIERDVLFVDAEPSELSAAIAENHRIGRLVVESGFITLPDRERLVDLRRWTAKRSAEIWPAAHRFGRILAALPFVRMVGVTGSLAADNPRTGADVDYLLITAPGRVWLARAGAIAAVHLATRAGTTICPNYLLSTNALALDQTDLYTAHELLQMVPLSGPAVYQTFLGANAWATSFLPRRARYARVPPERQPLGRALGTAGETLLLGPLGEHLDRWEWRRKSARLRQSRGQARFTRDVCAGHYGKHRDAVLHGFRERCERVGIETGPVAIGAAP